MKTKTPQGAFLFGLLVISCLVVSMTVTGCKNEADPKSGNSITSFKIGEIVGAILGDEISVIVPADASLTNVSPVITLSEGANVLPASETVNDFTNPTTYTVTAENGSARTFVVTVIRAVPELKTGNAITSFKINNMAGVIQGDEISVIVAEGTNLSALSPVITFSEGATVLPASGTATDFTNPTTYAVTAENGSVRTFVVTVTPTASVVLGSIEIFSPPYKTTYQTGEAFDSAGLVVEGFYSDGSSKIEDPTKVVITNFDANKEGKQNLVVTVDGKTTSLPVTVVPVVLKSLDIISEPYKTVYQQGEDFVLDGLVVKGFYSDGSSKIEEDVTLDNIINYDKDTLGSQTVAVKIGEETAVFSVTVVKNTSASLELSLSLVADGNDGINVYGLPEGDIKLSRSGDGLPDRITISTGTLTAFGSPRWTVDGTVFSSSNNIITLNASNYTLTQPHNITVVAYRDGVRHSKSITFTVAK